MSKLVSTIYYNDSTIEIYWDSNVLVQHSGLWLILPNMTIRNVLYSLGFLNNTINISNDVLDTYVSSAPTNTIYISIEKPSELDYNDFHDVDNVSKPYNGCIKSIIKKLKYIEIFQYSKLISKLISDG